MKTTFPKFPLLVAILVVGAGALGWRMALARKPAQRPPAAEAAEGDDELAQLRRQVRALQDDQSRTRLKVDSVVQRTAAGKEPAVEAQVEPEPTTPEELRKRDYDRSKHVVEYVQRIMDDESPDLTWAPARVEEIKASFKDLKLTGFALRDAECRATLCRMTLDRGPDAITQELGTAVMQLEPLKKMGAFFHYEDDRVVMYSPREGHDFPKDPAPAKR